MYSGWMVTTMAPLASHCHKRGRMTDLSNLATLYEQLLLEAEKLPPLFRGLVQPSEEFVEVNRAASIAVREAADATYSRKADFLREAGDFITRSSDSLRKISDGFQEIAEIHLRIQAVSKQLSDTVSG